MVTQTRIMEALEGGPPIPATGEDTDGLLLERHVSLTQQQFIDNIFQRTGVRLYTPVHADQAEPGIIPANHWHAMKATMRWIYSFIMQPHPNLGRGGVVCPYVKTSLDSDIFYLTVADMRQPDRYDEVFELMRGYSEIFGQIEPTSGPLSAMRVLMVLFPYGTEAVLDHPKKSKQLKTQLMRDGVTIGQFFPTDDPTRYFKAKFFPVQPPLCMYTMRTFIESDWMFIHGEPEWREAYLERFGAPPKKLS